jgi:hypothetical protein
MKEKNDGFWVVLGGFGVNVARLSSNLGAIVIPHRLFQLLLGKRNET